MTARGKRSRPLCFPLRPRSLLLLSRWAEQVTRFGDAGAPVSTRFEDNKEQGGEVLARAAEPATYYDGVLASAAGGVFLDLDVLCTQS